MAAVFFCAFGHGGKSLIWRGQAISARLGIPGNLGGFASVVLSHVGFGLILLGPLWCAFLALRCSAEELPWIRVSEDGRGFVTSDTGDRFVPWGFNYDHEGDGRLIEDYWHDRWSDVESAFDEMKQLGANVVRIHLQFGKFMDSPNKPHQASLARLARLLRLAERTGIYIDLTGLGCYHKQDVPPWYDAMTEQERWEAQAVFWDSVAEVCCQSPAIFCYDLMNEPVVAGGDKRRDDWLGPGFGGKHFVQFITLERKGRERSDVALSWTRKLSDAIRTHDQRHLITVGLVPWSLERPGLSSGFVPQQIVKEVDFIAVHLYPEKGKVADAIDTLEGFAAAGKPVVIEETFNLKCGVDELENFIDRSRSLAAGWIGFYWGRTPEEIRPAKTLADAFMLRWLELFQRKRGTILGQQFLANGVTAHRGNSWEFPENTLPAFRSGITVGADWIELDLFLTSDGQLAVTHDAMTGRVGDRDLVVNESSYEDLSRIDVATEHRRRTGGSAEECPPQRIPLLQEVLRLVKSQDRTRVSLQPKMDCVAEAVALVKQMNAERWVGFNDGNLQYMIEVKRLAPSIPVFWDRGKGTDIDADIAVALEHDFESLVLHHETVTPEKVSKIRAAKLEVGAWTVNDAATMRRLLAMGVTRLYTDKPRQLLELIAH